MIASAGWRSGLAGLAVLAAYRAIGQGLDRGDVHEVERGRGGDDLDSPSALAGERDERADLGGGACAADDDGQDAGGLGHWVTPIAWPKSWAWRWMLGGAEVIRSRTIWWTAGRPVISSGASCSAARSAR